MIISANDASVPVKLVRPSDLKRFSRCYLIISAFDASVTAKMPYHRIQQSYLRRNMNISAIDASVSVKMSNLRVKEVSTKFDYISVSFVNVSNIRIQIG